MTKVLFLLAATLGISAAGARAQGAPPDTARAGMPALELPEITIVGKKAITLPFARKGEIFDVNIYDPPPPDSSFLIGRPRMPLPVGEYNRLAERISPWHASVGGGVGSFATFNANGFVGWTSGTWDIFGKGLFTSTNGHEPVHRRVIKKNPAGAIVGTGEFGVQSILTTDNDLLKSLGFGAGASLYMDSYTLFGLNPEMPVPPGVGTLGLLAYQDRSRRVSKVHGGIGSVRHEGFIFGLDLAASVWSITDNYYSMFSGTQKYDDSSVTVALPRVGASLGMDIGRFRFASSMTYESGSLDYSYATQSPSLLGVVSTLQWQLADRWSIAAGLYTGYGGGSDHGSSSLFMPTASLRWLIDGAREFSVWWKPQMQLVSYDSLMRLDPYLQSEIMIRPERRPIEFGSSFSFNTRIMNFTISGHYRQSTNRPVILSEEGRMTVAYLDAVETSVDASGSFVPFQSLRITYGGMLQRTVPDSGDVQLPMTPGIALNAKGEYTLPGLPVTVYSRADYRGKQNVDLKGVKNIEPYMTLDAGASTTAIPDLILSLDLMNLTNTGYQWWDGYAAPGLQINLSAKYAIQ